MAKVTGIGGVFFKAKDAEGLRAWYRERLGIAPEADHPSTMFRWRHHDAPEREGATVWSVFDGESEYFGPRQQPYMINYRVDDMEALLAGLEAAGVEIAGREDHEYGRFAWIVDPEGNRVELWEPPADA